MIQSNNYKNSIGKVYSINDNHKLAKKLAFSNKSIKKSLSPLDNIVELKTSKEKIVLNEDLYCFKSVSDIINSQHLYNYKRNLMPKLKKIDKKTLLFNQKIITTGTEGINENTFMNNQTKNVHLRNKKIVTKNIIKHKDNSKNNETISKSKDHYLNLDIKDDSFNNTSNLNKRESSFLMKSNYYMIKILKKVNNNFSSPLKEKKLK